MDYAQEKIWSLIHQLTYVRRAPTPYGIAPHKPVLLLALLDYMEKLALRENKFAIGDRLFLAFDERWKMLIDTGHKRDVSLPLYHLQTDELWTMIDRDGKAINRPLSKTRLKKEVAFGRLDKDLFTLAQNPDTRNLFRTVLLDHYFPDTKENYLSQRPQMNFLREIELEILEDAPVHYGRQSQERYGPLRHWKFRHNIMQLYGATCCVSGLHVDDYDVLIDAAHIKPFREFKDNSIRNGLALSPTLHRAFDNGLLSVDNDFHVRIGKIQAGTAAQELLLLEGKKILLPKEGAIGPTRIGWPGIGGGGLSSGDFSRCHLSLATEVAATPTPNA